MSHSATTPIPPSTFSSGEACPANGKVNILIRWLVPSTWPNVFFCGWLPHDVLSQGLNLADVFVAPSHHEPFGQVYLEAMAAGVPVIATRSGGPLDFVVDSGPSANGWLCEVDDVESVAAALRDAVLKEGERKKRGSNALALVRAEYDWEEIARRYVGLYRDVTKSM